MQCYEMGINGTIDHLQEIYLVVHVRQKSQTMYSRMLRVQRTFPTTTYAQGRHVWKRLVDRLTNCATDFGRQILEDITK